MGDLEQIKGEAMRKMGWAQGYTDYVSDYYERFLNLRNVYNDVSPPDDVDNFWHVHILNTYSYYSYCIKKFSKLIHHKTTDAIDVAERGERLKKTIMSLGPFSDIPNSATLFTSVSDLPGFSNSPGPLLKEEIKSFDSLNTSMHDNIIVSKNSSLTLHFSTSSDGPDISNFLPYEGACLLVLKGQSLAMSVRKFLTEQKFSDGHFVITQKKDNNYHAYIHGMGSHGYC